MSDLPHVPVGIGKGAGISAPVGARGRTLYRPAGMLCRQEQRVDLILRSDVVRELDPGRTVASESCPQPEDHSAGLEKHDLVVGLLCASPSERLIECSSAGEVVDSEGHETDALFHAAKYVSNWCFADPRSASRGG